MSSLSACYSSRTRDVTSESVDALSLLPGIHLGYAQTKCVAEALVQHDFDASPVFERFVIPSIGIAEIPADSELTRALTAAAQRYLSGRYLTDMEQVELDVFDAAHTQLHVGVVASGDRFVSHEAEARSLVSDLPSVLAVEMEGAAVAQVCAEAGVPFAVFRSISDRADEGADVDFLAFTGDIPRG